MRKYLLNGILKLTAAVCAGSKLMATTVAVPALTADAGAGGTGAAGRDAAGAGRAGVARPSAVWPGSQPR